MNGYLSLYLSMQWTGELSRGPPGIGLFGICIVYKSVSTHGQHTSILKKIGIGWNLLEHKKQPFTFTLKTKTQKRVKETCVKGGKNIFLQLGDKGS